jgi:hypothetical protein
MLEWLAWLSVTLAVASALIVVLDELRHPQSMAIMNVVWPVTALYLSVFALWWYFRAGRRMAKDAPEMEMRGDPNKAPTIAQVALAASHCGAGCALADIGMEFSIFAFGLTVAGSMLLASYLWDFVAAWTLGILFQYFSIQPMRKLSPPAALLAAIKADTFSILAFQVGMYLWMALAYFKLSPSPHLEPNNPVYWLSMQAGMICGFLTSMPMNRLLIAVGLKEKMG